MRNLVPLACFSAVICAALGCAGGADAGAPQGNEGNERPPAQSSATTNDAGSPPSSSGPAVDAGTDALAPSANASPGFAAHRAGPDLPTPRMYLGAACAPDGRVFAIGGQSAAQNGGRSSSTAVEIYEPSKNVWTTGTSIPTAQAMTTAAVGYDGRIYAFGGSGDGNYAYDPKTNAWRKLSSPKNVALTAYAMVPMGHSLALVGGPNMNTLLTYDIDQDAFVEGPAYPPDPTFAGRTVHRSTPAAGLLPDGSLWMIGGFDTLVPDLAATTDTFVLAPNATSWKPGPSLPTALARASAVIDKQGRLVTFGGQSNGYVGHVESCVADVLRFDGTSWMPAATILDPRVGGAACVDPKGNAYFIGGEAVAPNGTDTALVGTVEIFSP